MAIPLSRFRQFVAESVLAAFNAKADLMRAGPVPIPTEEFVLTLSGRLIDDLGGVGINEISRITQTVTPEGTQTTTVTDPGETTITTTLPETTSTSEQGVDSETGTSSESSAAEEESSASSTDSGSESAGENLTDNTQQGFGRRTATENEYRE